MNLNVQIALKYVSLGWRVLQRQRGCKGPGIAVSTGEGLKVNVYRGVVHLRQLLAVALWKWQGHIFTSSNVVAQENCNQAK